MRKLLTASVSMVMSFQVLAFAAETWSVSAPLPTARFSYGAAIVDGKIYIIGGENPEFLSTNEMYDPSTDSWTSRTPMPTPRSVLRLVVVDGKIYAIGGKTFGHIDVSTVERYDPVSDSWTTLAPMTIARHGLTATLIGGKILVMGGAPTGSAGYGTMTAVEEYDPASDSWVMRSPMPTPRMHHSALEISGQIYVLGGDTGSGVTSSMATYDPASESWTGLAPMPTARGIFAASILNGRIYAIGGWLGWTDTAANEEYDLATQTWTSRMSMPGPQRAISGIPVGDSIHVLGGHWSSPSNLHWVYTPPDTDIPPDIDLDGIADAVDNCPEYPNPAQVNIDGDALGDLCDLCPADPMGQCNPEGSNAEEIASDAGGTVETPDGGMSVDIPPGALSEDETISVTETVFNDPAADLALSTGTGKGLRIRVYDLQPDGATFNTPVTITIVADVATLNDNQRSNLSLYLENASGDLEPIPGAVCTIDADVATCTALVTHFSVYALVAPLDGDGDGLLDRFNGIVDVCPTTPNVILGLLAPMVALVPAQEDVLLPDKAFQSNRTIPMKLDYLCGTDPLTSADEVDPPKLVSVWRVGDAEPLPVIDPDTGEISDSGVWFRYSDEHWVYNYKTKGLAQGTYEVRIQMPDGRTFKGGFVLK